MFATTAPDVCFRQDTSLPSPKLARKDRNKTLYPYYAGFSEDFVKAAFAHLDVQEGDRILDPWNGSGTTTLVGSKIGADAIGIDLNPVLSEISIARSASIEATTIAFESVQKSISNAKDLLIASWNHPAEAIHAFGKQLIGSVQNAALQREAHALINLALFSSLRTLSLPTRSSNPTWFKATTQAWGCAEDFINSYCENFETIISKQLLISKDLRRKPSIVNADFLEWDSANAAFDAVITSPPYLTRIDYVKSTLPELAHLALTNPIDIVDLRKRMLGTPITSKLTLAIPETIGIEAFRVLDIISNHSSKASSSYYYRFYAQYFVSLALSVAKIARFLKDGGGAVFVVQTSFYKEHLINLPKIVSDMASSYGMVTTGVHNFENFVSMNYVNTRAHSAKTKMRSTETAVFLRKTK